MIHKVHKTYIELIKHGKQKLSYIYKAFQKKNLIGSCSPIMFDLTFALFVAKLYLFWL